MKTRIILFALMITAFTSASFASVTQKADEAFNIKSNNRVNMAMPNKENDEVLQALINETVNKFQVRTYSDNLSGLSIKYNVFLPENYSPEKQYPAVIFIADASGAGKSPEFSLKQGYGGIIWASEAEQSKHECIVIVPVYPGVILDDHDGFVLTDYVELTADFIRALTGIFSIDINRIYATGQSMGCMTFLAIASKYPDLITAALFVSGQWDITQLEGIAKQKFIYAASAGDSKASAGQHEVIEMLREKNIPFVWFSGIDAKNPEGINLSGGFRANFVTFEKGSTLENSSQAGAQEHMTSFDYVYKISALRDWLFAQ